MLITSILALSVLVGCGGSNNVENKTNMGGTKAVDEKKDINDLVTIKEAVNKEGVSPNGDKVKYIYKVPIINIDKPGAQKINDMFMNLEKDMEKRIGNGQNMTLSIPSKAFLNDGIISVVMEIKKGGPGGIYTANYDIQNDKEISTKELLEKYKFEPQKLIAEINRQTKIDDSKPVEEQYYRGGLIDLFAHTVIKNIYFPNDLPKMDEELKKAESWTKEEKERYVIENIDKIKTYINNDSKFVFIHSGALDDEELVVE